MLLKNGERLDQETFHQRYEMTPSHFRAELIGGDVHLGSRVSATCGRARLKLLRWLADYSDGTFGTEALSRCTVILGESSEVEPCASLLIDPEQGGSTWENDAGYLCGPSDFVREVSDSTESIDLHAKKQDYEAAGVREYFVSAMRSKKIFWFIFASASARRFS